MSRITQSQSGVVLGRKTTAIETIEFFSVTITAASESAAGSSYGGSSMVETAMQISSGNSGSSV